MTTRSSDSGCARPCLRSSCRTCPDPVGYPAFLEQMPYFQRLALTEADARRAETYRAQGLRRELQKVSSMEEFLASLGQEVSIEPVHAGSLPRAAQLCQRTNQFNLTTRRYTVTDIERMSSDPNVEIYTMAVKDRFGDSGTVGLGICAVRDTAEIDTLLLAAAPWDGSWRTRSSPF